MIITRLLAPQTPQRVVDEVAAHVRAELSASAAEDDDPTTHADDVLVHIYPLAAGAVDTITGEVYESACILVRGILDRPPAAPYLKAGYDPTEGVPPELLAHAVDEDLREVTG